MRKTFLGVMLLSLALFSCKEQAATGNYNVIPRPLEIVEGEGEGFLLNSKTSIVYEGDEVMKRNAEHLSDYIKDLTGLELEVTDSKKENAIRIAVADAGDNSEAYKLTVDKNGVNITGASAAGVFYGIQTLRKSIPAGAREVLLPAVTINDSPRFSYRGAHLDVSRHYFTPDSIKRFIDILALHNLNRFHWHITDDQGWRIEIKKYPKLTTVAAERDETVIGRNSGEYDGKHYGPFYYTQDECREIVAYAAERYIEVVPEIDMPGHMVAALASYPELGCRNEKFEVRTRWGISKDVLCVGKESTFDFIEGVLEEVVSLFPSKYIHIGGDECPRVRWKECPHCQQRIQQEGLKDENELQSYFMHRVEKFLAKHNRRIVGWDEIIYGGINKSATIMLWNDKNRSKVVSLGNDVILTPKYFCYMDYYQTKRPFCNKEGLLFRDNRILTLRKAYSLNPYEGLQPSEYGRIKGVQANLWTEYVADFNRLQIKLLPRLAATAEAGWTIGKKDFDDFAHRMEHLRRFYDKEGLLYATYFFDGVDEVE